jgi:DNA-binding transcriptional LysR family regulator
MGHIELDIGWDAMDRSERIERRLKLHDLRVLIAVVEQGSMGKAAEQLDTSQPAISRAIGDLERSLGVRLLDRGSRGIVPTPHGLALIKRSVAVFDELSLGVKELEFLSNPTAGEVRIAAPVGLAAGFVATAIDRVTRRHPRVVCHLMVGETGVISRALEARDVDMAITRFVVPITDNMEAEALYEDPLCVVAATKNPWSRRRRVRLADLMNEPWTLPPTDTPYGATFADAFRAFGLDLPRASVVTSTDIPRIALVAKGRFLTIVTETSLRFVGRDMAIQALPIDLPGALRPIGIVTLKNRTLTPVARLFIDCAREVAKPSTSKSLSARRQVHEM